MTNEEIAVRLSNHELVVSSLSREDWLGFLFDQLRSRASGEVLLMTRPVYETGVWNETLAMSWLQLLEGLKVVQSDWLVLVQRCPELLDGSILSSLYSTDALNRASKSNHYIPPDKGSVGDLILALMENAIGPVDHSCTHCGTGNFVRLAPVENDPSIDPLICFSGKSD